MKALDTNVLVRYLVQDDPIQGEKSARFIQGAAARDEKLLIDAIVLCELVWVLESAYGYAKDEIAGVLEKILSTGQFQVEQSDLAWLALADYREHRADFADCLIGRRGRGFGAEITVTFNRALKGLETFEVI